MAYLLDFRHFLWYNETIKCDGRTILITAKDAYIKQLENTIKNLEIQISNLSEMVILLRKNKFGSSSEKTSAEELHNQLTLFNEAETEADSSIQDFQEPITKKCNAYSKKNLKTKRNEILKDLPVREILCDIPKEDQYCAKCAATLKAMGKETIREELEYIPAKLQIVRYIRMSYECPRCKHTDTPSIKKALTPTSLMNHSLASPKIGRAHV